MSAKEKKQKRILYFCFVILLVVMAVAAAVAGTYKKSEKKGIPAESVTEQTETAAPAAKDEDKEKDKETDKKEAGIVPPRRSEQTEPVETEKQTGTEPVSATPEPITFTAPVSGSVYGEFSDAVPVFSNTMNDYRTHAGVDVAANVGDPVLACADGVIDDVWEDPMMGQTVKITHADGFESVYRNLSTVLPDGIAKGVTVKAGQTIGAVGDTALIECEDEPHLHFELLLAGAPVDPSLHVMFTAPESDYEG